MADILLGILAIVAGGVMLFAGQFVLRLVLSIWGFFAGFAAGAGLFAELADESFLGTALGWVSGFVLAVVFAALTYFFFAVAVVLAMAAFGYAIGAGIIVALGIDWSWVAVLVGVAVGVVFGVVSLAGNMPMVVLAVVSSLAGAVSVVGGVMLLVGALNSADFAGGRPQRGGRRVVVDRAGTGARRDRDRRAEPAARRGPSQRRRGLVRAEPHRLTRTGGVGQRGGPYGLCPGGSGCWAGGAVVHRDRRCGEHPVPVPLPREVEGDQSEYEDHRREHEEQCTDAEAEPVGQDPVRGA